MADNKVSFDISIGTLNTILFLIFLTLKLMGHITWSWWWVFAPLWIPICIVIIVLIGGVTWIVGEEMYRTYKYNKNKIK